MWYTCVSTYNQNPVSLPVEDLLSRHSGLRPLDRVIGHAFSIFVVFRSQLHIFCSVWSLNLNYFLRWFLLVFLLGAKPSLCNAPARWFDLSLWWLLCSPPLLPHAHQYALTTVYLAVPETLEFRVFPMVVTLDCSSKNCPLPRPDHMHTHVAFLMTPKLRTSTMMQNLHLDPLRSLHITFSPKGNMCLS